MPKVPAELKKGVTGYIAPSALFFFRWGAALTVLTGAIFATVYGALRAAPDILAHTAVELVLDRTALRHSRILCSRWIAPSSAGIAGRQAAG